MKSGKFVVVDPRARSYSKHIPESEWDRVKPYVEELHQKGVFRSVIRAELRDKHDLDPSPAQLQSRMQKWGLLVYKNCIVNADEAQPTTSDGFPEPAESELTRSSASQSQAPECNSSSRSLEKSTDVLYEPSLPDALDDIELCFESCLRGLSRCCTYQLTECEHRNNWLAYSLFYHGHRLHSQGLHEATSILTNAASLAFDYMKKPSTSLIGDLLRIYFIWSDKPRSTLRDPTYQFLVDASTQIPDQETRLSVRSLLHLLTRWDSAVLPKDAVLERFLRRQAQYPVDRIDTFYEPRELFIRILMEGDQHIRAEKECRSLLGCMIELKGTEHADTRRLLRLLGRIVQRQGKLSEAKSMFMHLWIVWQRDYESNVRSKHVRDWCTVRDLAVINEATGDTETATYYLWQTYVLSLIRYGDDASDILCKRFTLVIALFGSEQSKALAGLDYHLKYDSSYFTFAQTVTRLLRVNEALGRFGLERATNFDTLKEISTGCDALVVW